MTNPSNTIQAQGPTALLALVQHIHEHGLGTPMSIAAPTVASPYFMVSVANHSLDAWTSAGFVVDRTETFPMSAKVGGRSWERVEITGRLEVLGIRVRVTAARPTAQLHLVENALTGGERGTCGCRQPVTNIGDRRGPHWVHDGGTRTDHAPFAITAVTA